MEDSKSAPDDEEMVEARKTLSGNYIRAFSDILGFVSASPFLSHGDYWINNIMYGPDCRAMKIVDWQILCCSPPIVDFCSLVLQNSHPDLVTPNLENLYKVYHKVFCKSCDVLGVEPLFTLEEFKHQIETIGFAMTFIHTHVDYV